MTRGKSRDSWARALVVLLFVASALGAGPVAARAAPTAIRGVPHHALEDKALLEPDRVLQQLPPLITAARIRSDYRELALLYLAQANACRVVANWACQRAAGAAGRLAATAARQPLLQVRSLILESRALIAMQDFSRGEELLGKAELLLKSSPLPELSADVYLAYSSLSYALGKHALSAEYAGRGLAVLKGDTDLPMQVRLLRNQARAYAQLGQADAADQSLRRAMPLAERFDDPKLSGELLIGAARMARARGDFQAQLDSGNKVIALGDRLKNSQLVGMGHEVLGLAALSRDDDAAARRELQVSYESYQALGLKRDELRVLRELLRVAIEHGETREVVDALALRFLDMDGAIDKSDRARAADDFDARMAYAEREFDVLRLRGEAVLAGERERALAQSNRQSQWLSMLSAAMLLVLGVSFLLQRRATRSMASTMELLRESEARAHGLLNLSAGFVFLHDLEGRLVLVNPAAAQALGQPAERLVGRSLQEFQPAGGREPFSDYLERVSRVGEDEGVFLMRSALGDHRHWRYSSRLSPRADGSGYVVGNAVDVTDQVNETQALHERTVRDALTGSYNRRQLDNFEVQHSARARWAAITVDLDHFKQINDTQGHDRGDQVLAEIANYLFDRVRADDAVVRLGGDEFVVLLARADAETMHSTVSRLLQDAALAPCAFTIGMALREGDESLAATIARADAAMYSARASARSHEVSPIG